MTPTPAATKAAEEILDTFAVEVIHQHPVTTEPESPSAIELAAIIDRHTAQQWLPIESAPRDGTRILILSECGVHEGEFANSRVWHSRRGDGSAFFIHEPTHWMPLPETPTL